MPWKSRLGNKHQFVANLKRPGANVTGIANLAAELTAKKLQLLHELIANAAAFALSRIRFR